MRESNARVTTACSACAAWTWRMEPRCQSCAYDLRGCLNPRCPECGSPYEPLCPVCDGAGRFHQGRAGGRLVLVASVLLILLLAASFVAADAGRDSLLGAVAVLGVVTGVLYLVGIFSPVSRAGAEECGRCRGTGIDFEDRVWVRSKR